MIDSLQFHRQIGPHLDALNESALRFTNDIDRAKDLMQDTLLRALHFYHKFEQGSNLGGWLFTIMRNTFINGFRVETSRARVVDSPRELMPSEQLYSAQANGVFSRFVSIEVSSALSMLPETLRLPFVRYIEGYQYREIAQAYRLPLGTVKTRIFEARRRLKDMLSDYRDGI